MGRHFHFHCCDPNKWFHILLPLFAARGGWLLPLVAAVKKHCAVFVAICLTGLDYQPNTEAHFVRLATSPNTPDVMPCVPILFLREEVSGSYLLLRLGGGGFFSKTVLLCTQNWPEFPLCISILKSD